MTRHTADALDRVPDIAWPATRAAGGAPAVAVTLAETAAVSATLSLPRATYAAPARVRRKFALHQQGVPVKAISKRVGHARAPMTLDTYSHVMPLEDVAAEQCNSCSLGSLTPLGEMTHLTTPRRHDGRGAQQGRVV